MSRMSSFFFLLGWGASTNHWCFTFTCFFQPHFKYHCLEFLEISPTSHVKSGALPTKKLRWHAGKNPAALVNWTFFLPTKKLEALNFWVGPSRKHLWILNWLVTRERLRLSATISRKEKGMIRCFFRPLPIIQKMHGVCLVEPFLVNTVGVQYFLKVFPRSIPFLPCFHNAAGIF